IISSPVVLSSNGQALLKPHRDLRSPGARHRSWNLPRIVEPGPIVRGRLVSEAFSVSTLFLCCSPIHSAGSEPHDHLVWSIHRRTRLLPWIRSAGRHLPASRLRGPQLQVSPGTPMTQEL